MNRYVYGLCVGAIFLLLWPVFNLFLPDIIATGLAGATAVLPVFLLNEYIKFRNE